MLYLRTNKELYTQIATLLPDLRPDIKINLLSMDENLEKLGFCQSAPCEVSIELSAEEYEQLLDELMDMEVDAFATSDGSYPADDDPKYLLYCKYGWLWDVLYGAETHFE